MNHHDHLWTITRKHPDDYDPYGKVDREWSWQMGGGDCSSGCVYFYNLASRNKQSLGMDWGVCGNPESHRAGLLTFEHQGCLYFQRKAL